MRAVILSLAVLGANLLAATAAEARVVDVEVLSRTPVAGGAAFGASGAYELVKAKVFIAEKPGTPGNSVIVDLAKADRDAAGEVHANADLELLQPVDPAKRNGTTIVEIPNRGGRGILHYLDKGDHFLEDRGYTVAWIGWQWDVPAKPDLLGLRAPVVADNGKPVTGLVRSDFVPALETFSHEVGDRGHIPYRLADENDPANVLTVRDAPDAPRRVIPRSTWRLDFLENEGSTFQRTGTVIVDKPFEPGHIYELVYKARDPVVTGMGFAMVRDTVAWMKRDPKSFAPAKRVLGFGISQSGRFLRHFLYVGMNRAEDGGPAFDGVFSDVAGAGRGSFNHRFAQPSRDGPSSSSFDYQTDLFPFSEDALLAHADIAGAKVFESFGSYEYWSRGASLLTTTPDGSRDVTLPENVRVYAFAGSQHNPGLPSRRTDFAANPTDPEDFGWSLRALMLALDRWCSGTGQPPPSRYDRVADGTLVTPEALAFPQIPGIRFEPNAYHHERALDFGPDFVTQGIVEYEPPHVGAPYRVLVPAVDADGNEKAGIRMPEVAVPLGTYAGWNPRTPAIGLPQLNVDFTGTYAPFARDFATRGADPRHSITERYPTREAYLDAYDTYAALLAQQGYVLSADLPALHALAERRWQEVNP